LWIHAKKVDLEWDQNNERRIFSQMKTGENFTQWSVRDVVTFVLLSVFMIVMQLAVNMVCMLNYFVSMVLSVGISCFLCAPVWFLLARRVRKRFLALLYMSLLGVVFLIMGDWFLLPYFVAVGIVCELILRKNGSYENPKRLTAAWMAYSVLYIGVNILPLVFFWSDFEQNALASCMERAYIDSYVSLTKGADSTWILALMGLLYLIFQGAFRQAAGCALFYGSLSLLLFLIREHGLRMVIFSEFHIFLFWRMTPVFIAAWSLAATPPGTLSAFFSKIRAPAGVILGVLVTFRFFPTMRAQFRELRESMRNRGLTAAARMARHPLATMEYTLFPMLLHCLQIADRLAVSAVARGIEAPVKRESYCADGAEIRDFLCASLYTAGTAAFLFWGGAG
jgi:putative ECF transporter S component (TIGR02185 family)